MQDYKPLVVSAVEHSIDAVNAIVATLQRDQSDILDWNYPQDVVEDFNRFSGIIPHYIEYFGSSELAICVEPETYASRRQQQACTATLTDTSMMLRSMTPKSVHVPSSRGTTVFEKVLVKSGWLKLTQTLLWFRKNELLPPNEYPPETDSPEAGLRNANFR
ncbi:hypothetical protein C8Q74DRAFT_1215159 [Fomes fomentarius]|nr:hypothetical protein C8Q74DRAFT_1215159 [Fomes fomentarius]